MDVAAILSECSRLRIALRVQTGRLLATPGVNVTPELADAIRADKPALMAIVGSKSWPWLSDPAFVLGRAHCRCGEAPWEFSERGEPVCRYPERPLSGACKSEGSSVH